CARPSAEARQLWRSRKAREEQARAEAEAAEEENTTNIHETLRQLAQLPWKDWLSHLDVLVVAQSVDARVVNGRVTLKDGNGRLGDCALEVAEVRASKLGPDVTAAVAMGLTTPTAKAPGTFKLNAAFRIVDGKEGLEKVGGVSLDAAFANLDVPYIARYYTPGKFWNREKRVRIHLGTPYNGKVTAKAATLAEEFTVAFSASAEKLFALSPDDPSLIFPGLALAGTLKGRLPGAFQLESAKLALDLAKRPWLEVTAAGQGALGEAMTLTLGVNQDLGVFAGSALARQWGLADAFSGKLNLRAFAKVQANQERSNVNLDLVANSLKVRVDGAMQDFPLSGMVAAGFALAPDGNARDVSAEVKIESPILNCATGKEMLTMADTKNPRDFRGSFAIDLNTVELCKRFRSAMHEFGLGDVQEKISGTVNCDGQSLDCALTLAHLGGTPDPLSLKAKVAPLAGDKREVTAAIESADQHLRLMARAAIVTGADGTLDVDFSQRWAMYLQKGAVFYRRFASLFGNGQLPAMQGAFTGTLAGKVAQRGDKLDVSAKANVGLEKAVLKDGDFIWQEPKAQISADLAFAADDDKQNLSVKSLQVRSASANLNVAAGVFPLHLLGGDLPRLVAALPEINFALVVGENVFRQVNYLTHDAIPEAYLSPDSQATVIAAFDPARKALNLKKVELKGGPKSAAVLKTLLLQLTVAQLDRLAANPTLNQILASLPDGLQIARAEVSVPALKKLPGALENASIRGLMGEKIILNDLRLTPKGEAFTLSGMAGAAMALNNDPAKPPLLQLGGWAGFTAEQPMVIRLGKDGAVAASGVLDLTNCAIRFNALSPYIYQKANKEPLRLSFSAAQHANGDAEVASAVLSGGMLPVEIKKFALSVPSPDAISVKLESAAIGAPFNVRLAGVDLDKRGNRIRGDVAVGPIDLGMLAGFMPSLGGTTLKGRLTSAKAHLDLPYQSLLGKTVNLSNLGASRVDVGQFALSVTNPARTANLDCSFNDATLDGRTGALSLRGLTVANPAGFSPTPAVAVQSIAVRPQLRTLGQATVVIDEVLIDGLKVLYQSIKNKGNNFAALQAAVEGLTGESTAPAPSAGGAGKGGAKGAAKPQPEVTTTAAPSPVLIKRLVTTNSKVKIDAPGEMGDGMNIDINLTLTDLGEAGGGNLFMQIVKSLTLPITKEIFKQLLTANPKLLIGVSGKLLDSVGLDGVSDLVGKAAGVPIDTSKKAVGNVLNVGKKILGGDDAGDKGQGGLINNLLGGDKGAKGAPAGKTDEPGRKLFNNILGGNKKDAPANKNAKK
ncbi:MAG: hypothetical protein J6333_08635, partial [Planctomycetes bacterium]|nr:hypothetical protein [Planctomycetota bacterium]